MSFPLRLCSGCREVRDDVTYDLRAHDFRCPDCREPKHDRFTSWEDIDAAEATT